MNKTTAFVAMLVLISALMLGAVAAVAQPLTGAPAMPEYKFSTPMPPGIASPDKVETRFADGDPAEAGTRSCAYTAPLNLGSTRPGGLVKLSW